MAIIKLILCVNNISGPNGIDDLFQHSFFCTIDWAKLKDKLQDPPFKPTVVSDEAFYFDSSFTSKTPKGNNNFSCVTLNSELRGQKCLVFVNFVYRVVVFNTTISSARPNPRFHYTTETETEYPKITETEPKPNPEQMIFQSISLYPKFFKQSDSRV